MLERNLGATLEAIHVFGSAVDAGLKPRSDIDLMVTVSAPLAASARSSLMRDLLSAAGKPGTDDSRRPLEVTVVVRDEVVPWRNPPLRELQFGEWLREELQAGIIDHDLAILLTQVRQHSVRLVGPLAPDLFDAVPQADLSRSLLDTVAQWHKASDWHDDERNVVLALARIWFISVHSQGGLRPRMRPPTGPSLAFRMSIGQSWRMHVPPTWAALRTIWPVVLMKWLRS